MARKELSLSDIGNSKFLAAADLAGAPFTAKIKRVEQEKMQDGSRKLVAYFEDIDKGAVLNKTRGRVLHRISGSTFAKDWIGCTVTVSEGTTEFKGDEVACVKFSKPNGKTGDDGPNDDLPEF